MPIRPYLQRRAFDPETIRNMSDAFTAARLEFGLNDADGNMADRLARKVIDLAERGVRTKTALYLLTVYEFKANPQ